MTVRGGGSLPTDPDRLDADLRKLTQLNESIIERDRKIMSALRRIAKRIDLLQRKERV